MIFHLYLENSEYFKLDKNYVPSPQNITELENLIKEKILIDGKNEEINNDLIKLKEISDKGNFSCDGKGKSPIDKNQKNELNIAKSFLDFYKKELHKDVHINKNKANLYILPRNMFNTEVKASEYLYGLESIIGKECEEKEIYGLNKKNKKHKNLLFF